jgi:hypothetical protein
MDALEPDERKEKVARALQDPRWDYRTGEGIAKQVGLPEQEVADALILLGDQVRRIEGPETEGRVLFKWKGHLPANIESTNGKNLTDRKQLVIRALADPRWDFRTIDGIAADTGLSEDEVAAILTSLGDEVRRSEVPDKKGRALFTLRSRPVTAMERLAKLRNFLAKSTT